MNWLTVCPYCSSSKDSNGKIRDTTVVRNLPTCVPQAALLVFIYSQQVSFMIDYIGYHILTHHRAQKVIWKSCNSKGWFWLWTHECYKIISVIANFTKFQRGVYYSRIRIFNNLPHNIKELANETKLFRNVLRRFLLHNSFYNNEEYFNYRK